MQPKLFVPFNVRNKIINEDGIINKDISDLTQENHYSTLTSYMKESKIYNAFIKRQVDGINGKTSNFGVSYDNFKKGISDSVKDIKYALDHPYASLNCGFIMNPSRFGVTFDDTSLKAYWKFNETSGDIINQSASAADLGSGADLQTDGSSYNQSSSPFNSMLFDGINDSAVAGTSVSQWNYRHSTTATWSHAWWMLANSQAAEGYLCSNAQTGTGVFCRLDADGSLSYAMKNSANANYLLNTSGTGYVPDTTNWYFYLTTYQQSLSSDNMKNYRNNANEILSTKTAHTPTNGNAQYTNRIARHAGTTAAYGSINVAEWSEWGKVLSAADQTSLYNSGSGLEIY